MSSPIGHTFISFGLYYLFIGKAQRVFSEWRMLLFTLIIGNLPDVDFIPGILMGNMNMFHEAYSHTVGFALMIGFLIWFFGSLLKFKNSKQLGFFSFALIFIHVFTDTFNVDSRNPVGVMLFWPIDGRYFHMQTQIFPPMDRHNLGNLFSKSNFYAVFIEIIISLPLFLLGLSVSFLNKIWEGIVYIFLFLIFLYFLTKLLSS